MGRWLDHAGSIFGQNTEDPFCFENGKFLKRVQTNMEKQCDSFGTIPNTTGSNVAPNNDRASTRHSRSLLTSSTHILITINRSGELKFGFKRPVSIIGVHFLCNLAYVSHKNSYLKATETISDEALLNTSWIN